jgi:D-glycero-alpha-D-manno-heptose 1-phosphate guanylyltransferase
VAPNGTDDVAAIVLAGGFGSRLGPLTKAVPKPMLPVGGRPFLAHLVRWLAKSGFRTVVFAVGYRAETVSGFFGDGASWGIDASYSVEREPLGTGGAIRQAVASLPKSKYLILNGDSFLDIDAWAILDALEDGIVLSMALATVDDHGRFGSVTVDERGRVCGFAQAPGGSGRSLINAGIYGVPHNVAIDFPPQPCSLECDILPSLIGSGVAGVQSSGFFVDIGVLESYEAITQDPERLMNAMANDDEEDAEPIDGRQ